MTITDVENHVENHWTILLYCLALNETDEFDPDELGDVYDILALWLQGSSERDISDQLTRSTGRKVQRGKVRKTKERFIRAVTS